MSALAARSRFVDAGGLRLRVLSFGSEGPDVLILPGITTPAAVFDFIAEPLSDGHAVHVMDLRGRGESGVPAEPAYSLEDYARDAAVVIDELGLSDAVVVGHSLGARIAAALAVAEPERRLALVLVDPPLSGPGREPYPIPLAFYIDAIRDARAGGDIGRLRTDHPNWSEVQLQARARWLPTCDEGAVAATHANFHAEDFVGLWRRLPAPLLIVGAESPVVPPAAVAELCALNPRAGVSVVAGAGHMVAWDQPQRFLTALRVAIAQVRK